MNRIEILFRLSDTADNLEAAGLFREAIVLTNVMKRMAQAPYDMNVIRDESSDEEPDYYYTIQNINDYMTQGKFEEARSTFDQYKRDMQELINISDNPNKRDLEKRLKAMTLQVAKLNSEQTPIPGTTFLTGLENNALAQQINVFGLERATDLKDFNRRWKLYMDAAKSLTYKNAAPNAKPVYYQPGMQQYFANLYEQLKLKYIK